MKFIALLLGLLVLAYVVKTQLGGTAVGNPNDPAQVKRQLDTVRNKTRDLSNELQKNVDEANKQLEK